MEAQELANNNVATLHTEVTDNLSPASYIVILKEGRKISKRDLDSDWLSNTVKRSTLNGISKQEEFKRSVKGYWSFDNSNDAVLHGFHGAFSSEILDLISDSKDVISIEPDTIERAHNFVYSQQNASWGLSRLSHKTDNADSDYLFREPGGQNTTIYIVDSGVRTTHKQFGGRAFWGANFIDNSDNDDSGHGTHVAGIAASHTFGASKFSRIVAIKVFNNEEQGNISGFLSALSWIYQNHEDTKHGRGVINYSGGGQVSPAKKAAIEKLVGKGLVFVTSAGNSAESSCNQGPADCGNIDGSITVAALTKDNKSAEFTNFGTCVDVYAPGVDILSSYNTDDSATAFLTGTSMSSPYVAGLASYFLSVNSSLTPAQVEKMITKTNMGGVFDLPIDTVNAIAYNGM
ncbi:subtilisin-like protein [Nadsonia fulvescens var. elongata DSM 6958]|uniref:Subtilisin-like protein n=1 Tax=Nadsonia fulvescens var. elongata DSM 6958 TaxID=857566 RepID=A0A1E3PH86_9ASCO|nr:subtilisin-like protein [Nadsonia fulvescens var. elongata DSM 6958]